MGQLALLTERQNWHRFTAMPLRQLLLFAALCLATPVAAQRPDSSGTRRQPAAVDSILHQGAVVQVRVPSLGSALTQGTVGRSNTSPGCLGIGLEKRDTAGRQFFTYLKGITFLQVDRRTNTGVRSRIDTPAEPTDWLTLTRAQIALADSGCHRK